METKEFIQNYREAFGSKASWPLLFGYSDKPIADSVVSLTVAENRRGGSRCFLGLFDPSVRPYVGKNELSFTILKSRQD